MDNGWFLILGKLKQVSFCFPLLLWVIQIGTDKLLIVGTGFGWLSVLV